MNRAGWVAVILAGLLWQGTWTSAALTANAPAPTTATPSASPTPAVPSAPVATPYPQPTTVAQTPPAEPTPESSQTIAERTPDAVTVGEGVYQVGTDLPPGRYRTSGPDADDIMPMCYWARLSADDGEFDSIIANGNPAGRASLTVKRSDRFVEFTGSCTWQLQQ